MNMSLILKPRSPMGKCTCTKIDLIKPQLQTLQRRIVKRIRRMTARWVVKRGWEKKTTASSDDDEEHSLTTDDYDSNTKLYYHLADDRSYTESDFGDTDSLLSVYGWSDNEAET
ncbi:uncharacterized protein BDZ99DRAFT_515560 [Mytilinidion resinicola]|uniref:Uncharacterized protein n=1 Tax=Mytilinidion resinicola TaxID=574789 RepID=A0A6A6Z3Q1_9PEZI|nr:uncharacterized protein BDZ99DRAFT_515560 [Mytilinidion resinicola]KAF2814785.1 hypothetical protein BDZ99DRAFT_515560 [Mytilinidion resinicola]